MNLQPCLLKSCNVLLSWGKLVCLWRVRHYDLRQVLIVWKDLQQVAAVRAWARGEATLCLGVLAFGLLSCLELSFLGQLLWWNWFVCHLRDVTVEETEKWCFLRRNVQPLWLYFSLVSWHLLILLILKVQLKAGNSLLKWKIFRKKIGWQSRLINFNNIIPSFRLAKTTQSFQFFIVCNKLVSSIPYMQVISFLLTSLD